MTATEIKALKNRMSELIDAVLELKEEVKLLTGGIPSKRNKSEDIEPSESFDFLEIYTLYPRKQGKTQGLKKCRSQIKSREDFDLLLKATKRYREYIRQNSIEAAYIKHFSSFMSCWKEWLDPETGKVTLVSTSSGETTAQYIARKERERQKSEEEANQTFDPAMVKDLMKGMFK